MHIAIALNIMVGFFSMAILTGYLAFVPPETMSAFILKTARRFRRTGELKASDAVPAATPTA